MKKILLITALLFLTYGNAQTNGENELGSWFMYFGTNQISDKFSIHTEAQFRYYEQATNFNQRLLRTGLNYHISPSAIATIGYANIKTDPTFFENQVLIPPSLTTVTVNEVLENRIFQQLILTNKVGEFLFEHRYRLEQRFIDIPQLNQNETQHRARYRLQVMLPLTDTFFLNFYNEFFVNLQGETFDQNRLYAALGVHVTENLSIQAGYLKNHFRNINFDRVQFGVFYNPDLRGLFKK